MSEFSELFFYEASKAYFVGGCICILFAVMSLSIRVAVGKSHPLEFNVGLGEIAVMFFFIFVSTGAILFVYADHIYDIREACDVECLAVDEALFTVSVRVGESSDRMWDEKSQKGILLVEIFNVSPEFPAVDAGDMILLEVVDFAVMGLPERSMAKFLCSGEVNVYGDKANYLLDGCGLIVSYIDE